jgi:hypothetical protein
LLCIGQDVAEVKTVPSEIHNLAASSWENEVKARND